MHSNTRFHKEHFGSSWDAANVAITVLLVLFFLIFLFLFLTLTAPSAQGQTSVPPTAVQAAKMPQFAARLHARAAQNASRLPAVDQARASYKNPADFTSRMRRGGPLDSNDIYDNGPTNGTTDGWTINFGMAVSDSFSLSNSNSANGFNFAAWLTPGDVLQSAEVLITSSEFGGTTYFDQTVNFTQTGCVGNQYGYNVCTESGSFSDVSLNAGTYWVTLQNAIVNTGDPAYWDENSGPSSASENSIGTIPSESFTILGETGTSTTTTSFPPPVPCFESGGNLDVVHDFTVDEVGQYNVSSPSGVTLDQAENIYGTTRGDDQSNYGLVYRIVRGPDSQFQDLYKFPGGYDGQRPNGVILGPDGALYGTAAGGINDPQNCNSYQSYCGLVYKLTLPANCQDSSCLWNATVIYRFSGGKNGFLGDPASNIAFDQNGNIFGTAGGGANGAGVVYELSPGNGGWSEKVLYKFPNGELGWGPSSLLVGHDGNLYGTGSQYVFQLSPSAGGWSFKLIHAFENVGIDYLVPQGLVQDDTGNLYGIADFWYNIASGGYDWRSAGLEYELSPPHQGGQWVYQQLLFVETDPIWYNDSFNSLAVDATGTTHIAATTLVYDFCSDSPVCYWYVAGGDLTVNFVEEEFSAYGIAVNPQGTHLYGVTNDCGANLEGTVWQISPVLKTERKDAPPQHSP